MKPKAPKTETRWGLYMPDGTLWCVDNSAQKCRDQIWSPPGNGYEQWKDAYRQGFRVHRVQVMPNTRIATPAESKAFFKKLLKELTPPTDAELMKLAAKSIKGWKPARTIAPVKKTRKP